MNKLKCYYCNKEFIENDVSFKLYHTHSRLLIDGKKQLFCDDECYNEYLNEHFVEEYNDNKIYSIVLTGGEHAGIRVFIPYVGCAYYFLDINECKNRIDNKNISVVSKDALRFMFSVLNN